MNIPYLFLEVSDWSSSEGILEPKTMEMTSYMGSKEGMRLNGGGQNGDQNGKSFLKGRGISREIFSLHHDFNPRDRGEESSKYVSHNLDRANFHSMSEWSEMNWYELFIIAISTLIMTMTLIKLYVPNIVEPAQRVI